MKQKLVVQREKTKLSKGLKDSAIFDLFYEEDGKRVVLQYSPLDKSWTSPGKNAASLTSDGNGFKVSLAMRPGEPPQELYLDYSVADYLRILLKVESKLSKAKRAKNGYVTKEDIVSKLSDLNKEEDKQETVNSDKIERMGDVMHEFEAVMDKMVGMHDLQCGEVLDLAYGYLIRHYPGCVEEYTDGTNPEYTWPLRARRDK